MSGSPDPRLAVLIDAETTPLERLGGLFEVLAVHGTPRVSRAYADWTSAELQPWFAQLKRYGIEPQHHFAARLHSRAVVALCLDALDLARHGRLDAVAVVGDLGSVLPLVTRLQALGLRVVGVGPALTPHDLRSACDAFVTLDALATSDPTNGGRHRA